MLILASTSGHCNFRLKLDQTGTVWPLPSDPRTLTLTKIHFPLVSYCSYCLNPFTDLGFSIFYYNYVTFPNLPVCPSSMMLPPSHKTIKTDHFMNGRFSQWKWAVHYGKWWFELLMERHGIILTFPPWPFPPGGSPQWIHLLHEYPLSSASNQLPLIHHNIQISPLWSSSRSLPGSSILSILLPTCLLPPLFKSSQSGFSGFSSKTFHICCPSDVLSPHLVCSCYSQREPQHLHQCLLSSHCLNTKQHVWCLHHLVHLSSFHSSLAADLFCSRCRCRGPPTCCYLCSSTAFTIRSCLFWMKVFPLISPGRPNIWMIFPTRLCKCNTDYFNDAQ